MRGALPDERCAHAAAQDSRIGSLRDPDEPAGDITAVPHLPRGCSRRCVWTKHTAASTSTRAGASERRPCGAALLTRMLQSEQIVKGEIQPASPQTAASGAQASCRHCRRRRRRRRWCGGRSPQQVGPLLFTWCPAPARYSARLFSRRTYLQLESLRSTVGRRSLPQELVRSSERGESPERYTARGRNRCGRWTVLLVLRNLRTSLKIKAR